MLRWASATSLGCACDVGGAEIDDWSASNGFVRSESIRLRRAPHVVSYWIAGRLVFHNYATAIRITADPLTSTVLDFFGKWRSIDALARRLPAYTRHSLRNAVLALERYSFLIRRDGRVDRRTAALSEWRSWNPAAGLFHVVTKDVRYVLEESDLGKLLRTAAGSRPVQKAIKRYPHAPRVSLPVTHAGGEFVDVVRNRRTWRTFSRRPIEIEQLSRLLALTFGIQGWLELPEIGQMPLTTSPSGGARHPIEAYVLARRVKGLKRGLYHYAPDRHELEWLCEGPRQLVEYLPTQTWFNNAAALILMTAVFPRVQWRYQFPRAYRVVLAETGHFCQTFCLTATWLGLAPFCTMALADSRIERDLKLDGITESVLYAAGVGSRSTNAEWKPEGTVGTKPKSLNRTQTMRFPGRITSARAPRRAH